jgi:hypothetical protein
MVNLLSAGNYAILAKTGISTVPISVITGDIAVSPITAAAMTGFSLSADSGGTFSTSTQVDGKLFAANYASPIPAHLTTAVGEMETAYTDAAGRPNADASRINLGEGNLGGVNRGGPDSPLTPGVYTFGTDVLLTGNVHFKGNGVYIIQITGNLRQSANYKVILDAADATAGTGQAKPERIFWQVAGFAVVGAGAHMEGIILAKTRVDFITGSSLNGRVLTQTACNLQSATITQPPAPVSFLCGSS